MLTTPANKNTRTKSKYMVVRCDFVLEVITKGNASVDHGTTKRKW